MFSFLRSQSESEKIFRSSGLFFIILLMLSGCDRHTPEALFENYRYRMENVLDTPMPLIKVAGLLPYPSQRDLLQRHTDVSINLIEFWKLRQCALQTLLGEKNNSLGKVMASSQEWIYAAKFLAMAPTCIGTLRASNVNTELSESMVSLIDAIARAQWVKNKEKYQYAWNATIASREFSHLFSLATPPLPLNSTGAALVREAWVNLLQMMKQYESDGAIPSDIEEVLKIMVSSHYLGSLLQAVHLIQKQLIPITVAITEKSNRCRMNQRDKTAIRNVFLKYYVGKVQPYLALLNGELITYQPLLHQFFHFFEQDNRDIDPKVMTLIHRYYQDNWQIDEKPLSMMAEPSEPKIQPSQLTKMKQVILDHAKAWKALSENCQLGLVPNEHE